ncbi:MAG TPA: polymer-forming cytoskeletal protein [Acidisarcina sp.]
MSPAEGTAASIGKSVQIRGEVKGSEDLLVDGEVEGTITLTDSRLTIGANARVNANVAARDVVILGRLNGSVTATGKVELRQGSNLVGDIVAMRLSIEENAVYTGKVDLLQSGAANAAERSTGARAQTPAPASTSAVLF